MGTIKELKAQWLLAKVKAGDFKGLGSARFNTTESPEKVGFDSIFNDGKKRELEICIADTTGGENYCWTWKELLEIIKDAGNVVLEITFYQNVWNKIRTEVTERNRLFTYTYSTP